MKCGRASRSSPADRICWIKPTRTCLATAPRGARCLPGLGWRVGDHRRELALGRNFAVEDCAARELADPRALLQELDLEAKEDAGLDRLPELHAVDGHEVNELARASEAKALDREDSGSLGQGFDLEHARHDRPS